MKVTGISRGKGAAKAAMATLVGILALFSSTVGIGGEDMTEKEMVVIDFADKTEEGQWRVVNDGVMGGLSQSKLKIGDDHVAVFAGSLSLANRGGFASVRRQPHEYGLKGFTGVVLRIRGDGRTYQFRVRTDGRFDGVSYRAEFETKAGEWMEVSIPFRSLRPTFRGRPVPDAPELKPGDISQVGFLIGDKREGGFRLAIDWIKAYQ